MMLFLPVRPESNIRSIGDEAKAGKSSAGIDAVFDVLTEQSAAPPLLTSFEFNAIQTAYRYSQASLISAPVGS